VSTGHAQVGGKTARDMDTILLVGGSTGPRLVSRILVSDGPSAREELQPTFASPWEPGVLASRNAGPQRWSECGVDVFPYFGLFRILGDKGAPSMDYCISPHRRNVRCH